VSFLPVIVRAVLQAALVTVAPGPKDNCPSSAQVAAALEKHVPHLLASAPDQNPNNQLTLVLSPALGTGDTSFFLIDKNGRVRIYRTLPPPVGDRARDCAALADTVAIIVERYFDELELPNAPEKKRKPETTAPTPAPPPPKPAVLAAPKPVVPEPPTPLAPATPKEAAPERPKEAVPAAVPPAAREPAEPSRAAVAAPSERTSKSPSGPSPSNTSPSGTSPSDLELPPESARYALSFTVGRRTPGSSWDPASNDFKLTAGIALTSPRRTGTQLWLETSASLINGIFHNSDLGTGSAIIVHPAVEVAPLLAWSVWRGRLYAGPTIALEYIWLNATVNSKVQNQTAWASTGGLRASYLLFFQEHFFARLDLSGNAAILRYNIVTTSKVWSTTTAPYAYVILALGLGISF